MILLTSDVSADVTSFPRACGDDPGHVVNGLVSKYFSPRMRG